MPSPRPRLVTSALPYANGSIHIGHMVEHIQSDIWVRAMRLRGVTTHFICADDCHGAPIMLHAEKLGITPEELIRSVREEHERDFRDFGVIYDRYGSTHSETNRALVEEIYQALRAQDLIATREIDQFYDPEREIFLPDRFIRGDCPRCGTADQYGDSCENCGATYQPEDLGNPRSVLTGATPEKRRSTHYFVQLGKQERYLREWLATAQVQDEVRNKLDEWFDAGLRDWDISRDAPYFGFEIPDAPGKFFYVWVDAPIGYAATFKEHADATGLDFEAYWRNDRETELHHFIGKDIVYFHTLFWPAMLNAAGFRAPTGVHVHGFLTVNGEKMSKSRGTSIKARTFLEHLQPDYLRYYYAAKLGPGLADIDLNLDDFVARVNSDLVGKVVNIASRCAGFVHKHFGGQLAASLPDQDLYARFSASADAVGHDYEHREYNQAIRRLMALADDANRYIDEQAPWVRAKDAASLPSVQGICTQGLNLFRAIIIYLKPVTPFLARDAEHFLGGQALTWADVDTPLLDAPIQPFKPLLQRLQPEDVQAAVDATRSESA